jgi:hypothetical protein
MTIRSVGTGTRPGVLRAGLAGLGLLLFAACKTTGSGDLSGTYEAKDPTVTMTLDFAKDHKVYLTMQPAGGPADNSDADYLIDGNKITVQVPGGVPFELVRNGKTLDGTLMGQILHFEKK